MKIYRFIIIPLFLVGMFLFIANSLGLFNKGVKTLVKLRRVDVDTTIYVELSRFGFSIPDEERAGGQFFVRARGYIDHHTEVKIFNHRTKYSILSCSLNKGRVDTVWGGDFYSSAAIVRFYHDQAIKGELSFDLIFSYPPKEWKSKL